MNKEILKLQFITAKNNFLYFPPKIYSSLIGSSVLGFRITTYDERVFYFSHYHVPSSFLNNESVGLSYKYAKVLGLDEDEVLIITPIYNIGSLQSINVTPISQDDLEMLSASTENIESSFLSQLRVVWPNQIFPIWISENIAVTLTIESLSPNLKYGRLEEYSEVVVNTDVKTDDNGRKNKLHSSFRSSGEKKADSELWFENRIVKKCLQFRTATRVVINNKKCKINRHPYAVFCHKDILPKNLQEIVNLNENAVWTLRKCEEERSKVIYVNLNIWENDAFSCLNAGVFKTLIVSGTVCNSLELSNGSKVILEYVEVVSDLPKLSGILVSSTFHSKEEENILLENIYDIFNGAILEHGDLLVNTKEGFPLDGDRSVSVTLRPLQLEWSFISLSTLKDLTIAINEYVSDNKESSLHMENIVAENSISSMDHLIQQGFMSLELSLDLKKTSFSQRFCDNMLFLGKTGCGKTTLVNCILKSLQGPPYYIYTKKINCRSLKGKRVESFSKFLNNALDTCSAQEPSVLFLDDLDLLAMATKLDQENSEASLHRNRISQKIIELVEAYEKLHKISVVASAVSVESLNSKLVPSKGKSLFTTQIKIPDLSQEDRMEYLKYYFSCNADFKLHDDINFHTVSIQTEGYTALDMKCLCEKTVFETFQRKALNEVNIFLEQCDFERALKNHRPASLQQVKLYEGSKQCWSSVGGLGEVKQKLIEIICWPSMFPQIMGQCPLKPQTGVLLYGAPGTGKTLMASVIAGESKMNFITIKGPELLSKYIGESEESIRKLFEKAQSAKPCLLFFDEFDSLAPRRGKEQSGVTDRVVNQLLTALDGVEPLTGTWVLAASSRPDLIDPALLRPGRIGVSLFCPLPGKTERQEILRIMCERLTLSADVDLSEVADLTEGFTGADLKGLLTSTQIRILDTTNELDSSSGSSSDNIVGEAVKLTREALMSTLNETMPSLSEQERKKFDNVYRKFQDYGTPDVVDQKVTLA